MKLLALLVLTGVLAAPVVAAPDGFRESVRLTPKVRAISGNPDAVVYCATSWAAWDAAVKAVLGQEARPTAIRAYVTYAENTVHFQQYECAALEKWLRGKVVSRYDVGVSAHLFAHEAAHLRGVRDEHQAECGSLVTLPTVLRKWFGVTNAKAVAVMVAAAREKNRRSPLAC